MKIDAQEAAEILRSAERVVLICHDHPDGDTCGSAIALCHALRALGKRARIDCTDPFPAIFAYMLSELADDDFEPETAIAVDVAADHMLGPVWRPRAAELRLCIDHHPSNGLYAQRTYVRPEAAATAELVAGLIDRLGVAWTRPMAEGVYTGLSTDTGCFRFANTTAGTHTLAARMMEYGARAEMINSLNFIMKSRPRVALEQRILSTLEYYEDGRISVMHLDRKMLEETGATSSDADSLSYLTRQVIGVDVGILYKEAPDGSQKISVRSDEYCDASALCQRFGGGGHRFASGCAFAGTFEQARNAMLPVVREMLLPR